VAKREDGADVLHRLLFDHIRRTDEISRRAKESEADLAEFEEEHERADAWLSKHWRTLDYDEEKKEFAIPDGWPPGHVRKPKGAAPPADAPEDEPPPDTMMHRMLKEKRGR
jgi:hypothetical protein